MNSSIFPRDGTAPRFMAGRLKALLGAAVLGAGLMMSSSADAYTQHRGTEGDRIRIAYNLPAFPHEARRRSKGYSGVRYQLCSKDATATGIQLGGSRSNPEADFLSICNLPIEFKSRNRFEKRLELRWPTIDDNRKEGDEHFWVYLTNPEVKRGGSGTWQRWNGSHHVPSRIVFKVIIRDND